VSSCEGDLRPNGFRKRHFKEPLHLAAAALFLTASTILAAILSQAYWYADDFLNFRAAHEMGLTWNYLSRSLFGHFVPLYQLTYYVLERVAPFNHGVVVAITVALYFVSLCLFYRLLGLLFGHGWLNLLLTGLFGSSILHFPSLSWWPSGLLIFTTIPLSLLCIDSYLRFESRRRRRDLIISVLAFTAALGFYEASMVVLGVLVLLAALYFSMEPGFEGMLRSVAKRWPIWAGYLTPACALILFRTLNASFYGLGAPRPPSAGTLIRFIGTAWGQGFVPAYLGLAYPFRLIFANRLLTIVLCQAAIVGVVAVSLVRRRGAWRAWIFFALPTAALLLASGWARSGMFGPGMGLYYQYLSFGPYQLTLALALAFLPITLAGAHRQPARAAVSRLPDDTSKKMEPSPARKIRTGLIVAAVGAVYLFQVGKSGQQIKAGNDPSQIPRMISSYPYSARQYFENFKTGWKYVQQTNPRPFLFDMRANALMPPAFYPFDLYSNTLGQIIPGLPVNHTTGRGYLLSKDGTPVPAEFVARTWAVLSPDAVKVNPGTEISSDASGTCIASGSDQASVTMPLQRPLPAEDWFLRMSYEQVGGGTLQVQIAVVARSSYRDALTKGPPSLHSGRGEFLSEIKSGAIDHILLTIPADAKLCFSRIEFGMPGPK